MAYDTKYYLDQEGLELYDSKIKEHIDKKIVQSDWNQNDAAAADYIKNRPFYTEEDYVEILPKTALEFSRGSYGTHAINILPSVGDVIIVNWDDTEYVCVGQDYSSDVVAFGNLAAESNKEPFVIYMSNEDGSNKARIWAATKANVSMNPTISISRKIETIHKLPEKYLPESVDDLKEQVDNLKEVQSDWTQNDAAAADYIKNRVGGYYGTVTQEIFNNEELDFSENGIDTPNSIIIDSNYTITDYKVDIIFDNVKYSGTFKHGHLIYYFGNGSLKDNENFPMEDTGEPFVIIAMSQEGAHARIYAKELGKHTVDLKIFSPGIVQIPFEFLEIPDTIARTDNYLSKYNNEIYVPRDDYHPATKLYVDEQIAAQHKEIINPDWLQNDEAEKDYIKNRIGGYYKDVIEEVYKENEEFDFTASQQLSFDVTGYDIFNIGNELLVTFDGIEYKVVGEKVIYNGFEFITFGNKHIIFYPSFPDTGEPFGFRISVSNPNTVYFLVKDNGLHTVSIGKIIPEIVKIPTEYLELPEMPTQIQADWNQNDTAAADYIKNKIGGYTVDNDTIIYLDNEELDFTKITYQVFSLSEDNYLNTFVEGTEITIIWDGVEYTRPLQLLSTNKGNYIYIGNLSCYDGFINEPDTGEPFLILRYLGYKDFNIYIKEAGSTHTVSINWQGPVTYKIPFEMLDTVGKLYKNFNTGEIFNNYSKNIASGKDSHAEGSQTTASNTASHAEGVMTTASGLEAHAEGMITTASGQCSHAEGMGGTASNIASHVEGYSTTASGKYSHAEGQMTIASGTSQHVQGNFNIDDVDSEGNALNTYAHIVGNGTSRNARSNAHTLDWSGNGWYAGNLYVGGTSQDDATRVATIADIVNSKYNQLIMADAENGYDYILEFRSGKLASYCAATAISVTTMPTKVSYTAGEAFDPTDMVVEATCQDGQSRIIKNFTYPETVTTNIVTISYSEGGNIYTTNIEVTVA